MDMLPFKKRYFESICRALLEISKGNTGYRLRISRKSVKYDLLAGYINRIGEMLKIYRTDPVYPGTGAASTALWDIYLSNDHRIRDTSPNVPNLLDLEPGELLGRPFKELLSKATARDWEGLRGYFMGRPHFRYGLSIHFRVDKWLFLACFCYVSRYPDGSIRVSNYNNGPHPGTQGLPTEREATAIGERPSPIAPVLSGRAVTHIGERDSIQEIARYMQEHLDAPLPDVKSLAHRFGINEKKLGRNFKAVFGQTPYAYHLGLRLERAMEILITTDLDLGETALSIGFGTRSSFYRAFKKRFGIAPGTVRHKKN
jgi:AraC-like DNA-binding protein